MPDPSVVPATSSNASYVRKRKRAADRSMTSLELKPEERELLGRIAKHRGVTIAAVLREGLRLVAQEYAEVSEASKAA